MSLLEDTPGTVGSALAWAEIVLSRAGVESPRHDAGHLLAQVLNEPLWRLFLYPERKLDTAWLEFNRLVKRRVAREPLAYILGEWGFHDLILKVDERALIPRPETELLVELALDVSAPPKSCLDLCTGSGAIALVLACHWPDSWIGASDLDPRALELAFCNAQELGLADRVEFRKGDLFEPWSDLDGVDMITVNPPYIATEQLKTLAPEIRKFESRLALDGGEDGLEVIRCLADFLPGPLRTGGMLLIEIASSQGPAVLEIFSAVSGLIELEIIPDLNGRDRIFRALRI